MSTLLHDDMLSNLEELGVCGGAPTGSKLELTKYDTSKKTIELENAYHLTTDCINYLHKQRVRNIKVKNYDIPCCIQLGYKAEKSTKDMNIIVVPGELYFSDYPSSEITANNCTFECEQIETYGKSAFNNCVIDVLPVWSNQYGPDGYLSIYSYRGGRRTLFNHYTIKARRIIIYVGDYEEFVEIKHHMNEHWGAGAKKY